MHSLEQAVVVEGAFRAKPKAKPAPAVILETKSAATTQKHK